MIFCRFEDRGTEFAGVIRGNFVHRLAGGSSLILAISGNADIAGKDPVPLQSVRLLAPMPDARNIFCTGSNYVDHVRESGGKESDRSRINPWFFMKPRGSMVGPEDDVVIPDSSPGAIDWECELAVVIGSPGKHILPSKATSHIAGFSIFIDYSDRKFQPIPDREERPWDGFFDWLHGKWHDNFSAMGPFIVTPDELSGGWTDLPIRLSVNGILRQNSTTRNMIFPPADLIGFLSRIVTLRPGDVIATGTPGGVAAALGCPYLQPGDFVEAEIPGLGELRNRMTAEATTS